MRLLWSFLIVGALAFASVSAFAGTRVALVIGNANYQHVGRLANPGNDAAAMTTTFIEAGFDVVDSRRDLTTAEMRKTLREFGSKVRSADVAVIYYAGHGIEIDGSNYLIPVDAQLDQDIDVMDEALSLDRVLAAVEPAKQLRLVILDACRDNPFAKTMKRSNGSRSVGRGLARVEPASPNTMIAFAAKAGSTASDGSNDNSPFAKALTVHLIKPGLDLRRAFGYIRDDVLRATLNRQEPFVYGSLGGDDVSLVPAAAMTAPPPPSSSASSPNADARRDYDIATTVSTKGVWDAFIANYPQGFYTAAAREQRIKLIAEEERLAAAEKAKNANKTTALLDANDPSQASTVRKPDAGTVIGPVANIVPDGFKDQTPAVAQPPIDLPRLLSAELRRVGCNTGAVSGQWNSASERALATFNKHAGTVLDIKIASLDALDLVRSKSIRVCPLVCEHGYKADGDVCKKVACRAGYEVGDGNICEKINIKNPTAKRGASRPRQTSAEATTKPAAGEQVYCNNTLGCQPVKKGCRIGNNPGVMGSQQIEICN